MTTNQTELFNPPEGNTTMRPTERHDRQLAQVKQLSHTFDKFRTITQAPDLLGDALRPHLAAADQLRSAILVGADQAAARARRLPEQIAAGEVTLDQAVTQLATVTAWTTPDTPGGVPPAATIADQAARCHEAAAIQAAREVAPQLYAFLAPFAQGAVAGADKAGRAMVDIPAIANYVRQLKEPYGGFRINQKTKTFNEASREAHLHTELFHLVHSTGNQLAALEGRAINPHAVTFDGQVNGGQLQFVERNVDSRIMLAVAVELGWKPGYYPPVEVATAPKKSRVAATAGAVMRAMAGAR